MHILAAGLGQQTVLRREFLADDEGLRATVEHDEPAAREDVFTKRRGGMSRGRQHRGIGRSGMKISTVAKRRDATVSIRLRSKVMSWARS